MLRNAVTLVTETSPPPFATDAVTVAAVGAAASTTFEVRSSPGAALMQAQVGSTAGAGMTETSRGGSLRGGAGRATPERGAILAGAPGAALRGSERVDLAGEPEVALGEAADVVG